MPRTTHGAYVGGGETPEHYVWREMIRRCRDGHRYYEGVTVCERWRSYENFIADMGPRPFPGAQIDRENPLGNYTPGNCRWVTRSVQQKNKRTTKRWSCGGEARTLVEWAAALGISKELAHWRMKTWGTFLKGVEWQLQSTK